MPHTHAGSRRSAHASRSWSLTATALAAVLLTGACAGQQQTEPLVTDRTQQVTATVESIDPATRLVRLRGDQGPVAVVLGPEVRNFSQIRVGDEVKATYYTGIAAQIRKHGDPAVPPTDEVAVARAAPGSRPAAGVAHNVSSTVTIESVDTSFNTVSFTLPEGDLRMVAVESPEGRDFIRTLRKGDKVDVTYTEAVAVEVVPGR